MEQRGAAQGYRGVPCVQCRSRSPFLLEQAVPLLDGARVGGKHARKAPVCLTAEVVELVSPEGGAAFDQLQVVGVKSTLIRVPETSEAWMRFPLRKNCLRPETTSQRAGPPRGRPPQGAPRRGRFKRPRAPAGPAWGV